MNNNRKICLSILLIAAIVFPVMAVFDNQANENRASMTGGNVATTVGNVAETVGNTATVTTTLPSTTETPIPPEERDKVINIVNNITVNIGINNTQIIDIKQDMEVKNNLRVRVKDLDTDEIIVIIVTPQGEAKPNIPVTKFVETMNSFTGKHVTFRFTNDKITDFTVDGKLIFTSIDLGFTSTKLARVGSEMRISDDKNMVVIHDSDDGIITEKSKDTTKASYEVATGIGIKLNNKNRRTDLSNVGSILSSDSDSDKVTQSVSGNTINVKVSEGTSRFVVKHGDEFDSRLLEGMALNKVGTIININSEDSQDITAISVDTTINKVATNNINLNVNSETHEGKVIALKVNKDILKDLNFKTKVDGNEIPKATDFNDLFKNDKLSYLIVIGQQIQVLISIPSFSEHQIELASEAAISAIPTSATPTGVIETTNPMGPTATQTPSTPGFTIVPILAIMAILYIYIRKKK